MTDVKPTQEQIVDNVKLLIQVAQSFKEEVPTLQKTVEELSNKISEFELQIEGQNRNIEVLHVTINEINQKVNEVYNRIPKINEEVLKIRQEYNNSLTSIQTNVKSFENSSTVLSTAVSRIDREIGDLAKSSEVDNIISAAISRTQLDLTKSLASKSDLDSIKVDIERKIQSAENSARMQFFGLLATLFLGFLGIIFTLNAGNSSVKQDEKINSTSQEKLQEQPTNLAKPTPSN